MPWIHKRPTTKMNGISMHDCFYHCNPRESELATGLHHRLHPFANSLVAFTQYLVATCETRENWFCYMPTNHASHDQREVCSHNRTQNTRSLVDTPHEIQRLDRGRVEQ